MYNLNIILVIIRRRRISKKIGKAGFFFFFFCNFTLQSLHFFCFRFIPPKLIPKFIPKRSNLIKTCLTAQANRSVSSFRTADYLENFRGPRNSHRHRIHKYANPVPPWRLLPALIWYDFRKKTLKGTRKSLLRFRLAFFPDVWNI